MVRAITVTLLLLIILHAAGQTLSGPETVSRYSVLQQRLLMHSTAQFINFITEDRLDPDTVMEMACRITGLPFILAYNEGSGDSTFTGADPVGAGRIPWLLEQAARCLFKPGRRKKDLDSAEYYIAAARQLAPINHSSWQQRCLALTAELYDQRGNPSESTKCFAALFAAGRHEGNLSVMAFAAQHLGKLLPNDDSLKLARYRASLEYYHLLQNPEKEIELLYDIAACHHLGDLPQMEKDLRRILALQQATGYRHTLYTQYLLSYALLGQVKYIHGREYAAGALSNMQWSGLTALSGSFYLCEGRATAALRKYDSAILILKKGLENKTRETHLFWYKDFLYLTTLLASTGKAPASLSLLDTIARQFPPITSWEKLQVPLVRALCYEELNQPRMVDKSYSAFLEISDRYKDTHAGLQGDYWYIATYYADQGKLKKARLFLERALAGQQTDIYSQVMKYALLFRLDSMEGNYRSAVRDHIKYKYYYDLRTTTDQQKQLAELEIRYATAKKEQDFKLLTEKGIAQQAELRQNRHARNIMMAGTGLLLSIAALLYRQFFLKLRTNRAVHKKNTTLQQMVEEKEWLLKEVHHRVKNNLHTVICLLESQAAYLKNDALRAIENSQHRIYAMSLIHQKLYHSEEVRSIDMAAYLPELTGYLDESFITNGQIRIQLTIDPLQLGPAQAIPIALIINEAVTNSMKYAFPGNRKGLITIIMRRVSDRIVLIIADNGIGIDPALAKNPAGSLGLKLINGLSGDLNANISIENDQGTKIRIVFDLDPLVDTPHTWNRGSLEIA